MNLNIILKKNKKKKKPFYKIILINKSKKKKIIDFIGTYDPLSNPKKYKINLKKLKYWITKGACISNTLKKYLKNLIFFEYENKKGGSNNNFIS